MAAKDNNSRKVGHQTPQEQPRRRPSLYLLGDSKEKYLHICVGLYGAILNNDWEAAERIIGEDRRILGAAITRLEETALHIAAGAKNGKFVEKLIKLMDPNDLLLQDIKGNTAFCYAAAVGDLELAKVMMRENENLYLIRGGQKMTPLYMAASFGRVEMAGFLYPKTKHILKDGERYGVFFNCIHFGLYDLALQMFKDDKALAMARDVNQETALHVLARTPSAFNNQITQGLWTNRCTKSRITSLMNGLRSSHEEDLMKTKALQLVRHLWKEILHKADRGVLKKMIDIPSRLLFDATESGNCQFLFELLRSCPDLLWETNDNHQTIFHVAALNRHASIFNLIHEIGLIKDVVTTFEDNDGNSILHLAATFPPSQKCNAKVEGKLFQFRQELQWFKAVKESVQPHHLERKNYKGLTPKDLFTITHKSLLRDEEHWMKSTTKWYMLVSALVVVGVSIVASPVSPGGINRIIKSRVPTILETIALFSSSISLVTFLSISTSRYTETDFHVLLPCKLIVGLALLFISVTTLTVASCGRLLGSL